MFPLKRMLSMPEAAEHIGITPFRLRCLRLVRAGPHVAVKNARELLYRIEDLDSYVLSLYDRVNISTTEQLRHRNEWRGRIAGLPDTQRGRISDPFMQVLTRDELLEAGANRGFRVAFLGGLFLIFLSHTPLLWRL
ncbi:DNA-binding protein [Novacetimonas pomaceti]|uniref:DNA-binding protein n=1 Tax=Novacetimonas pomaceti TaxID=2021998 RepID=A0A318QU33_9PROT|nr:DNA-binding protein [Novacetimonas pomaceti]MBV1833845.1 DNA-binding protein [Novacetimonas pomaceti]PYD46991.1 DNA-binding protein [Novacetimonas pomaceti]PYD76213.1 DNA-binding protein [Novacetimonas pomaceti]